jgi:hypothetical protein
LHVGGQIHVQVQDDFHLSAWPMVQHFISDSVMQTPQGNESRDKGFRNRRSRKGQDAHRAEKSIKPQVAAISERGSVTRQTATQANTDIAGNQVTLIIEALGGSCALYPPCGNAASYSTAPTTSQLPTSGLS